ncbi:tryptophan halogenase family protein [Sphingomonas crusticola]|uniref:tryptophan halogenase family protein n=1 Tax=Sphingomonas crusticola TaxID=1697973 RepID=UPI001F0809AC|nr:tryptophan halogenase family protein [Sphingomonas crusticola]
MAGGRPIRDIVVAGGGIVAWSCAAALKRQIADVKVTIVATAVPDDALAERMASTLPSTTGFHRDIGLSEADTVVRAGSGFRLGTLFQDWGPGDYAHVYGSYGQPFGTASFHHHWVRAYRNGTAGPYDAHAPAAALGRASRFTHPHADPASPLAGFEYGLVINPPRYREMMRAYALHLGVAERSGEIAEVRLAGDTGFVEALVLADGSHVSGHLFVDCTGPAARVRSALDAAYDDWSRWLPCDRILFAESAPPADLPTLDHAAAMAAGWRWTSTGPARTAHGLAYASAHLSDEDAARSLPLAPSGAAATIRPGRRPAPWLRNCVAIGDAAIALDPLEWTNLHLAHSAIDRLVAMMPDRDFAPVELWDYNRQTANETDRVRDLLALHYRATSRTEPMWRAVREVPPPDSLAHTLSLFGERGRLPFYEEETFSRDSWLAVLLGQGIIPRRTDPLIDSVPPGQSDQAMAAMRAGIATTVSTLPTHSAYLLQMQRQIAR